MKLSDVGTWPSHKGKKELLKHMKSKELTYKEAVLAKCYECNCGWADGTADCKVPDCPLYGFMSYRYKPVVRAKRGTEEQRAAARERLRHMGQAKKPL